MADDLGAATSDHPNLNLNAEEKRVYAQLFKEADPDGFGAVSGDVAVKFFEKTKLAPDVLGQIWQIADTENRGFLTVSGFAVVLRLIGHAQSGRVPTPQIATQPAPLPRFDGPLPPPPTAPLSAQNSGTPASPSQAGLPPIRVPAITPEKASEYSALFEKSGAENGSLPGVVAKQIFERARLPNEVLGRIWNLSDTQGRGALDSTEFVIAMHLLASYKSGAMRGVPSTLPPGLYEAASRRQSGRPTSFSRPASGPPPAASAIPPQFSGYGNARPQSPISRQQVSTPLSSQSTGEGWVITPADKARFDQVFAGLDKVGRGYITGDQAVEFFGNARLPEEILAQIWDLADINSEGQLNRDEFAVAMYLIRQQRGTRDGRGNLPSTLPPALVPPSMRKQQAPPSQPTAPAFENATVTQPRSAADDLFGLDAFAPSAPAVASAQIPQSTGGTDSGPFANPRSPAPPSPSTTFKPFVPSSSFGQSILPQATSASTSQSRSVPTPTQTSDDLLGDADPEVSQRLTSETSELANLSNQVGNLSKQTTEIQGTRKQTENELSQNSQQKREFEARLGQLRALYEQEVKDVKALQTQLTASRSDTTRLQQDVAMIDGTHQDLRTQHQRLAAALQTDQQENAALKEKIRQTNAEIEQLKPQLEKLRSDARQHKGLVAINKKQLSTNEAERDRIRAEISAAQKEAEDAAREAEETAQRVEASHKEVEEARSVPQPSTRNTQSVVSPAPSTASNPFFRNSTFSPPIAETDGSEGPHSAFDSIFGPSFGSSSQTAAPATSFTGESPMQSREVSGVSSLTGNDSPAPTTVPPDVRSSARQITSSALPFRVPLDRADSISSSVKVAPPASRLSPADTPRALTPTASSPSQHENTDPFTSSHTAVDTSSASGHSPVQQTTPPASSSGHVGTDQTSADASEKSTEMPGTFPSVETPRSRTPQQHENYAGIAAGAGAATLAAGAGIAATVTHKTDEEEPKETPTADESATNPKVPDSNFDDFFGGPAHQRTRSEQVADFDSAFASMGKSSTTNGTQPNGNSEFPAIQELDGGDSSDYTDETPGFDDDFNSKSPPKPSKASADATSGHASQEPVLSAVPGYLQATRPSLQTASSAASSLPDIDSQKSPPTYNESVPGNDPSHFPPEFKGLLPSREDPTSPTAAAGSSAQHENALYGPELSKAETQPSGLLNVASKPQPSPFDFDSDFAGMAPAQVEEEDDEEEESFSPARNHATEFDPTFDSSPIQPRSAMAAENFSPTSVYSSVTNGVNLPATQSTKAPAYDFDTFESSFAPQAPTTTSTVAPTSNATTKGTSHDWDNMFAGIDAPPAVSGKDVTATPQATTSAAPATTAAALTSPSPPAAKTTPQKPPLGRALTTGTEHDAPILKQLVSMGWSREESLAALEKFDYNLDKAADYLTFRS